LQKLSPLIVSVISVIYFKTEKKNLVMKKILFLLLALPFFAKAQEGSLMVNGTVGNLYLNHTAAPKESFYSIGRLYNISPKEIAPYNNLVLDKGVSIGQNIKIPLKTNFIQDNSVAADEAAVAVYHKVEAKETLYQLSTRFNKVPVASIKAWNNLQDDVVSPGQGLIIGFLKVKKELSSLSQNSVALPAVKSEPAVAVVKEKAPIKKEVKPKPVVVKVPEQEATKQIVQEEIVKAPIKEVAKPIVVEKEMEKKAVMQKVVIEPKKDPIVTKVDEDAVSDDVEAKDFKGGVFKPLYGNAGNETSGTAGVFKSTSGWEDGKYYCLHNSASQGTIVKVTNKVNGKFIYAKVLDLMPDLKQNNNLKIRISNAAADVLGAGLSNFECLISY
jgi:LysM repeat protein